MSKIINPFKMRLEKIMRQQIFSIWPIFFGLALMMIGNSLQGTLLGVRANVEGFSVSATGIIMAAFYMGFLAGSFYVPRLVSSVGHIRVFAALASVASTAVLMHGLYVDPLIWTIIRVVTGFSYAGLYIVVESWLNDVSTNENRGRMMGVYMVVTFLGMTAGQMMLNIADPNEIELFVITSILVSLALLPIALSSRPAPEFNAPETLRFNTIWSRSPLGVAGMIISGFGPAVVFTLGPLFVLNEGYSMAQVSLFMATYIVGGAILQIPISWLSDRMDRRKLIIALCLLSTGSAFLLYIGLMTQFWVLLVSACVFGAISLPIYGQCASHVNDHLSPRQFVAASGTLLLINGAGAMCGPLFIASVMEAYGANGFIFSLVFAYLSLFVFGIYRAFTVDPIPLEDQGDAIIMPARGSAFQIYSEEDESKA